MDSVSQMISEAKVRGPCGYRRSPLAKPPRMYCKSGEALKESRRRWLPRWMDWRDYCVMTELNYQDSLPATVKHKQFRKAFWGVEGRYLIEAGV